MANYQSTHTGAEIDAGIDLLDNNSATSGQVLTANGTGGASWQNASGGGGGTQLYKHSIIINNLYKIILYSKSNNTITNITDLATMIEVNGAISSVAYDYDDYVVIYNFEGIKVSDTYGLKAIVLSKIQFKDNSYQIVNTTLTSVNNISDTVTPL